MTLEFKDLTAVTLAPLIPAAAIAGVYTGLPTVPLPPLDTILPAMLGVLALAGFAATPVLLPARGRQRASTAVGSSARPSPPALACGTGAAPRKRGRTGRGAHPDRRRASLPRRRTGAPALGVGRPHSTPGRAPVDRLTPHYRPGRATVHQGGTT